MKEAPGPHRCHCFAARQLARHVSKLYERHLSSAHITSAQFSILILLRHNPGMTMRELADEMVMDRTTLLRAVKPLQRDGLVSSTQAQGARELAFSLSRKGAGKIEVATPMWEAAQAEYEAEIGADRATRLRRDFLEVTRTRQR